VDEATQQEFEELVRTFDETLAEWRANIKNKRNNPRINQELSQIRQDIGNFLAGQGITNQEQQDRLINEIRQRSQKTPAAVSVQPIPQETAPAEEVRVEESPPDPPSATRASTPPVEQSPATDRSSQLFDEAAETANQIKNSLAQGLQEFREARERREREEAERRERQAQVEAVVGGEPETQGAEGHLGLLIMTWILEIPGIILRWILLMFLSVPVYFLALYAYTQYTSQLGFGAFRVGFFEYGIVPLIPSTNLFLAALPLIFSIAWLILPGGDFWTRISLGARDPSKREREMLTSAVTVIGERNQTSMKIYAPHSWYVVDSSEVNAFVIGTTLYLTREMLRSPYLAAVLAHEYGHLNSWDGRLVLVLRRLVLPFVHTLSQLTRQPAPGTMIVVGGDPLSSFYYLIRIWMFTLMLSLVGGGFGLWLLNPLWLYYWRDREYVADRFAAALGFAGEIEEFLEQHHLHFDTAVPYFLSTYPYTELRIDRLQAYQRNT
jgi:Zn-dependent protease with chaperone function